MQERSRILSKISVRSLRTQRQLACFVIDVSSSMSERTIGGISKIDALNTAINDLVRRLKDSSIARNFDFAIVTFSSHAEIYLDIKPLGEINDISLRFTSTHGGTNLTEALELAYNMITRYYSNNTENLHTSAVVLISTDGEPNIRTEELPETAGKLKSIPDVTVACCFLPSLDERAEEARNLMKNIVTSANFLTEERDIEGIRNFFLQSITKSR